jgi:hypothetical protein
LPVVPMKDEPHATENAPRRQHHNVSVTPHDGTPDVLATIEKLAELHAKGILNDEEFSAKKAELLRRV